MLYPLIRTTLLFAALTSPGLLGCAHRGPGGLEAGILNADRTGRPRPDPVLLVALHGANPAELTTLTSRGVLSAGGTIASLLRSGVWADHLVPVDAALTSTARATMLTGALPGEHGVVDNVFHHVSDSIHVARSGFQAGFAVETLWEATRRQGLEVARIGTLFVRGSVDTEVGDVTLAAGTRLGVASVVRLRPDSTARRAPGAILESAVALRGPSGSGSIDLVARGLSRVSLHATAVDMIHDGHSRYDAVVLDDRDPQTEPRTALRAGQWMPIEISEGGARAGAWLKLLSLDPENGTAHLYVGAPHASAGYPDSVVRQVETAVGYYPGAPDYNALSRGEIDEATWVEQAERENRYFRDAALAILRRRRFDLVIFEQPGIDNAVHQFAIQDSRHPAYASLGSAGRARLARHIERLHRAVDENLGAVAGAVGPRARLVATSDYSLIPTHTRYALNGILAMAGLRVTADARTEVRATASSTTGHVYVNLAGREPGGIVAPDRYDATVRRVAEVLRAFRDTATGEPVFEEVMPRSEQARLGILAPEVSGDVWVRTRLGYTLSSRLNDLETLRDTPSLAGEHGYRSMAPRGARPWRAPPPEPLSAR